MSEIELWPVPDKGGIGWRGQDRAIILMRALLSVIAREYGGDSALLADLISLYKHDGWGLVVMLGCDTLISGSKPVPSDIVALYREVGEGFMADDPEFMDDYYEDLVRLAA